MKNLIISLLLFPVMPALMFGGGKPASTPAPAPPPQEADQGVIESRDKERMRRRAAASDVTLSKGPEGTTAMPVKTALGQ